MNGNFDYDFQTIGDAFGLTGTVIFAKKINSGNINKTYKVTYLRRDDSKKNYLFQKVNTYVFKQPIEVMENIDRVTMHIRRKHNGADALHFHHTADRNIYYFTENSEGFWRVSNYFESVTFDICDSPEIMLYAGQAFGRFQKDLQDFDASLLHETIPDFHHTRKRLEQLFEDAEKDPYNRVKEVRNELSYIKAVCDEACTLIDMQSRGELPLRVTHNDTKINNVLFCPDAQTPITVIDLDTVMPGLLAYDFGDAVRFGASTAAEDEKKLSKIALSLIQYNAFCAGFIPEVGSSLTENEEKTLALGAFCITVELAARFLDDYITGNKYFKILYPEHNLMRTRAQLTLAQDIHSKLPALQAIVDRYYNE